MVEFGKEEVFRLLPDFSEGGVKHFPVCFLPVEFGLEWCFQGGYVGRVDVEAYRKVI